MRAYRTNSWSPIPFIRLVMMVIGLVIIATPGYSKPKAGQVHGNWTVRCETEERDQEHCYIFQNLVLREGGQRVLHVAAGYVPGEDYPILLFTLPLGISLPFGATVVVDDGERARIPIERCEPKGCRGGVKLTPRLLQGFQKGREAVVTFQDAAREPVNVTVSLKGFTAGLKALR